MIVLSSNDYDGPYEQKYDPEHKKKPKGPGWRKIESGWARGSNKNSGGEHEPSKVIKNTQRTIPSIEHCNKIKRSSRCW